MSHLDALFGDTAEFGNENDGEILSEDEAPADNNERNDDPDNPEGTGDGDGDGKPVTIEPKQKTIRNPRYMLNAQRLCGPRGINDMESYFKGIQFKGKGNEMIDLDVVMRQMQHWAHRMYPKYGIDDCLATIENLGRKKQMQAYMNKYRMGLLEPEIVPGDEENEEEALHYESNVCNEALDPLDSMLEEQIAISKAGNLNTSGIGNLSVSERNFDSLRDRSITSPIPVTPVNTPKGPSPGLSEDVRAKIAANRLKALEIRKAKMAAAAAVAVTSPETMELVETSDL